MTTNNYDAPGQLMKRTLELLKAKAPKEVDLFHVHDETGLPFFWLRRFASGGFKNPSVNRVQFLYEKLTGAPLTLQK